MKYVGREEETRQIDQYLHTRRSELVALYGRRRVGKTYLVRCVVGKIIDFEFTGMYQTSGAIQRLQFQKELNMLTRREDAVPQDWFEAFDHLRDYLRSLPKDQVVVFLDEIPWMDTAGAHFLAAFSRFWNDWNREDKLLKIFVCGSATTWMLDKLIGDRGGLYGRVTHAIYLAPLTLRETEQYLNEMKGMNYDRKQVLDTYMVFGGIPFYLEMLDPSKPFTVNVDRLFYSQNAPLKPEYEFLFRSLFKNNLKYRQVIELLSTKMKGLTREEIIAGTKMEGGELSRILKNLNSCDFIRIYTEPKKAERGKIYQLTDMFCLFYLRFVQNHNGQDQHFWTNSRYSGKVRSWSGYAFEQVCLHHIPQIKKALGISGILSNHYAWSCKAFIDKDGNEWKGGQIDLIIDRDDHVMNLCEMKYSSEEYVISKEDVTTIRERTQLFRREQKTTKNLRCTFITPYGVKQNMHSGIIDHQLRMDDLF
ncbi:MAG: AAA family ATPase [Clostridia bacterium]|nr:AAA family ATPase [Clostridia bacterium]